ncbi:MAG TPA: 1-(5-phosphoribosyl)-5-[(5-phosphoribosylamino)methylideneamino]imidazole-4-carboxamide isomerase [Halanaerobiales bacterium]|nr:1-(5-phosphoribosyl)-5-[(5-phosphoribosylamino)methylideneamino]imidazole-4-carboxamide isomerase [Halanaerobiales bacterium]
MFILPAIDIKDGKVVRLKQGDFDKETIYSESPVDVASQFADFGAKWLHIVDLDGAASGAHRNLDLIKDIRKKTNFKIQCGGGVRSKEDVQKMLAAGINRVIIGTLAVKQPDVLTEILDEFDHDQILISIDARKGKVATSGWKEESDIEVIEFAKMLEDKGVKYILYTDIARDGMLVGPDFEGLIKLKENTDLNIIASGGVSALEEIERLDELNFYGVIIGQALYQGKFSLKEAISRVGD